MKIKHVGLILLCLLALFAVVSCKSTPSADADQVNQEQVSTDALGVAVDRALAAQKLISDFEGPVSFPVEWKAANDLLGDAETNKSIATIQEIQESTERYVKAAEAFEGMSADVLGRYYEVKEAEIIAVRNAVVAAGAEELIPELLADADNAIASAEEKYEVKDYYGAKDSAGDALAMYETLKVGLDAYAVREKIAERNFEGYDPQNIALADDTLRSAADDYTAKNMVSAKDKAEAALLRYNLAIKTAWESYAAGKGSEAASSRQAALDVRANVAVRQEFNTAQDVFNRANSSLRDQKYDEAAIGFEDSIRRFDAVVVTTGEKRVVAEEALELANQRMAESDEMARNAEVILEGGEE